MEETLIVFIGGITGVFLGMLLLYVSIKLMSCLAEVIEQKRMKSHD